MAIARDAISQTIGISTTPITQAHTCSGGSGSYLIVVIDDENSDSITSVTYNGVAMTLLKKGTLTGTGITQYIYGLANPASGTNNIVVNFTNGHFIKVVAISYTGVQATGQPDGSAYSSTASTSSSPFNVPITVTNANCWLVAMHRSNISISSAGSNLYILKSMDANNANPTANNVFDSNGPVSTGTINAGVNFSGTAAPIGMVVVSLIPGPSTAIKKIMGVDYANIKKVAGVAIASVKKAAQLA